MPTRQEIAEIDRIVDRFLEDRAKAAELKRALHADFAGNPAGRDASSRAGAQDNAQEDDDAAELWDNLPV